MDLYLHFGINKTGSSYIQYACAQNRDYLQSKGIYFPSSNYEKVMRSGNITPGNTGKLMTHLSDGSIKKSSTLFLSWENAALNAGCDRILISAESMVHVLATDSGLNTFKIASKLGGIEKIHAIGYFRDLVDHAISTYKHRAKSGKLGHFENWISNNYETPTVLEDFFDRHQSVDIKWTFRKFQNNSIFLLTSFFHDWLKIEIPPVINKPKVNESITLSEVLLMNEITLYYSTVTDYFVNIFKSISKENKANDELLEIQYRRIAYRSLISKEKLLKRINFFIDEKELLFIGNDPAGEQSNGAIYPAFSLHQIQALLQGINYLNSTSGKLLRLRRKIKKWLPDRWWKFLKRIWK